MDRTEQERHDPLPLAHEAVPHDETADDDPRARWRSLPAPITSAQWVAGQETDPIPEQLAEAEARRMEEERNYIVTRLAGGGAPG